MSDSNIARMGPTRVAPTADIDFPSLISTVLERGLDPAVIQSVLAMYNDHQDRRHQEALNNAVASVCADIQPVVRDAQNTHLRNRYASHGGIMQMLQPLLHRNAVRVGFDCGALPGEQPIESGCVRVRIVIGHGAYCERNSYIDEPVTQAGSQGGRTQMTQNQALSSATTYAQRTLLRLKFNIATVDDDDDGEATRQDTRDTQGTAGAERQQQNARAGMTSGTTKPAETKPAETKPAGTVAVDHEAYKAAFRRRLHLCETELAILELLGTPEIKAWIEAAPLRIKGDIDAMIEIKTKLLRAAVAAAEREAAAATEGTKEADAEAGTNTAAPSELLTKLLARVASCLTTVALDSVVVAPEFTSELVKLNFVEGDVVNDAIKQRFVALEGK